MLFVKIWDDIDNTRGTRDWEKIQEAVLQANTFYKSEIVLCSLRRFREEMWKHPRSYQNLHLMEARYMLTGNEIWDFIEQVNPDVLRVSAAELD